MKIFPYRKNLACRTRFAHTPQKSPAQFRRLTTLCLFLALSGIACLSAHAQKGTTKAASQKLPAPDKIVADYLKAIGGKKHVASLNDAAYVWSVQLGGQTAGNARTHLRAPASTRTDIILDTRETNAGANARTAWVREADGILHTLTDAEASAAKLRSTLDASRLADFKKQKILARTVGVEQADNQSAYVIEFSTRDGARLRYMFSASSKLLLQVTDDARRIITHFADYHAENEVLEPHRIEIDKARVEHLTLILQSVRYNTGLSDALFEPPGDGALNVPALLREVEKNQRVADQRVNEYSFIRKETQRKVNDKGEVTKETVTVHEVFPVVGWGVVEKLISENGVPLSSERAAKEEKRVGEELERALRELPKLEEKRKHRREERAAKRKEKGNADEVEDAGGDDNNITISDFLRVCELIAPRRERLRERETIVFDFRPRANYHTRNRAEAIIAKLNGVVWINPEDKQVMRLEARFAEGFKMGGGLLASIKPGSAFVFEQTRLPDGVWLPRFAQINAAAKIFLFAGFDLNATREYSDYKRFSAKTGDVVIEAPKNESAKPPHPQR